MSRALVTGGAGFIGSQLVDVLIAAGHQVMVLDNLSSGNKAHINPKADFIEGDITTQDFDTVFQKYQPEVIFHLAAQIDVRKSVADPAWDAQQNIFGFLRLCEAARRHGIRKIIFSSSGGAIYGDTEVVPTPETIMPEPRSPYGVAKLAIEKYLHYYHAIHGIPYVALRYANVYGPRQGSVGEGGVVAVFAERLLRGDIPTIYGDGEQTRDFVYVGDVVAANLAALSSDVTGAFNVGTGIETTVNQLADQLRTLTGITGEFTHAPVRAGEQQRSCLDYRSIQTTLNWQPQVSLEQGLAKTLDWWRQR